MNLSLGSGNRIKQGWINHDRIKHRPEIDISFDLEGIFPLKDNQFDKIQCYDVLEHLNGVINFMDECHRILKPKGILDLKVCGYKNENFHIDITHKHAFHHKSMDYFDPSTEIGKEYSYYTDKKWKIIEFHEYKNNYFWKMEKI